MSTPSRVLLDTNIVLALFAGEPLVVQRLAASQQTFVPVTVLGELYHGALQSVRVAENLARLRELSSRIIVLSCDTGTAETYGSIRTDLARKGKPIPQNDVWIAAIARQHDLVLLTKDLHFTHIDHLAIELLQ